MMPLIGRLSDRLVALVVPGIKASAECRLVNPFCERCVGSYQRHCATNTCTNRIDCFPCFNTACTP
jgi:hypothetical protein